MTSTPRVVTDRRGIMAITSAGLAAALWVSFTSPFTLSADIVTAIPLGLGAVLLVQRLRPDQRSAAELPPEPATARVAPLHRWALVWLGLALTIVAWELYNFASAPRSAHPTLSSLIDMLTASQGGKFVAFFLWLALGWYLVVQ
jgi:hypothetical protein